MTPLYEDPVETMAGALAHQADACARAGSSMYEGLFRDLARDYRVGGHSRDVLGTGHTRPVHDAIPLRLAAVVHRMVLEGSDDRLSRHYPSVGGAPGPSLTEDFLRACTENPEIVGKGLARPVQTNEVGRSLAHLALARWIGTLGIDEYTHLEVGASAGLTMNFQRFSANDGRHQMGEPGSHVFFDEDWFESPLPLPPVPADVLEVLGCDPNPIDIRADDAATALLSYVWPDQHERLERTRAAIRIAKEHPPRIERASAENWIGKALDHAQAGAVLVFHSIVWQYMGEDVQRRFVREMQSAGARRGAGNPVIWARMEPAGSVADLRATTFADGHSSEFLLAEMGYHGRGLRWMADRSS